MIKHYLELTNNLHLSRYFSMKVFCTAVYCTDLPQNIVVANFYIFVTMTHNQIHQNIKQHPPPPPTHTCTQYTPVHFHLCTSCNTPYTTTAGTDCTDPDTVECLWWSGFGTWVNDVHMYYCYMLYKFQFYARPENRTKNSNTVSIPLFPVVIK
jgi:hypothetical protein